MIDMQVSAETEYLEIPRFRVYTPTGHCIHEGTQDSIRIRFLQGPIWNMLLEDGCVVITLENGWRLEAVNFNGAENHG